jgi:NADP-dependent 3-hydroxy acid dehydrogenase YdfG
LLHQAPEFIQIQRRAEELGTELHYRRIDVRDTELLNSVIETIANEEGRMDGLIAAAGIQQETPALEYSAKDSNTMFEVNVTGVFMTAQAVAKQMIRFGNGGSIALIASMSGTIVNRVCSSPFSSSYPTPFQSNIYPGSAGFSSREPLLFPRIIPRATSPFSNP